MAHGAFSTVSVRLLEYAEAAVEYFEDHGYKVYPEKMDLGFPYTPTLLCKRSSTMLIVEVAGRILDDHRINAWHSYAQSCSQDTRFAICLHQRAVIPPGVEDRLRIMGTGLYIAHDNKELIERIPPRDLALHIVLPPLNELPKKLQRLLGSTYEQFDRTHWREGFEDACQTIETQCRKYLKRGVKAGRIIVMSGRGPRNLTPQQIDKMTMGSLAKAFASIQNQNYLDTQIGKVLYAINSDRVGVAHHKAKLRTEKKLRANAGKHMWAIVGLLREMMK